MLSLTVLAFLALSRAAVIPLRRQDANPKLVVAHFMVGNTFPYVRACGCLCSSFKSHSHSYTLQDWTDDINLATASGLDGFALNVGPDDFQATQTSNA